MQSAKILATFFILVFVASAVALPSYEILKIFSGLKLSEIVNPDLRSLVKVSFQQAFASAVASLILGICLGLSLRKSFKLKTLKRWQLYLLIPFCLPTLAVGMMWTEVFGNAGLLSFFWKNQSSPLMYRWAAVIAAHMWMNIGFVAIGILSSRLQISENWLEAAQSLGASKWKKFQLIVGPAIAPIALLLFFQIFQICLSSFSLVLLIGGGPPIESLETAIYSSLIHSGYDLSSAGPVAAIQACLCFLGWIPLGLLIFRRNIFWQRRDEEISEHQEINSQPGSRLFSLFFLSILGLPLVIWLASLGLRIFKADWEDLVPDILSSLATSLKISGSVFLLVGALSLSLLFLLRKNLGRINPSVFNYFGNLSLPLLIFPSLFSTMVFAVGYWGLFEAHLDPTKTQKTAIVLLQTSLYFPILLRWLVQESRFQDMRISEAAMSLGASDLKVFRHIDWQRWKSLCLSLALIGFAFSIGDLGSAILFVGEDQRPLSVLIFRLLTRYQFDEAAVLTALLLFISISPLLIASRRQKLL